jgi:hypothetical protein
MENAQVIVDLVVHNYVIYIEAIYFLGVSAVEHVNIE